LTTSEAGKKLGITSVRVWQLIRDGRLKATKFGHIWMIDEKDLAAIKSRPPGRPPVPNPVRPRPRKRDRQQ